MKLFSLATSLLIIGGTSLIASGAQAQIIDVPFTGNQADACVLVPPVGLTVAAALPGTMELINGGTAFSSIDVLGGNGTIALLCTGSYTASVDAATVRNDGATGPTVFDVFDPGFNGDLGLDSVSGILGDLVLEVDLSATTSSGEVIAAGDYDFIVPVTITPGS